MPLITLAEIIRIIIMTLAVGYIFSGFFKRPKPLYDVTYTRTGIPKLSLISRIFDWESIKFAIVVTAPAIILHELGHKFVAIALGYNATFYAAYEFLILGIILRIIGFPFIFFIPGYVSIPNVTDPLHNAVIAFAGPFVNLVLWLVASYAYKHAKNLNSRKAELLFITYKINMFLFILNILPIWFFGFRTDGFQVLISLIHLI